MSSLLTNNSAMVALQTLRGINKGLAEAQSDISTGKRVANASDNAALWAISSVMQSDLKGFKAISESLSLGASTLAVGRQASETVTDLLNDLKAKVIAAQEENVDRSKIQDDVDSLVEQIKVNVGAAQFNGLNLLSSNDTVNVLASLDRQADGTVSTSQIQVQSQDLRTVAATLGAGADLSANIAEAGGDDANAGTAGAAQVTIAGTPGSTGAAMGFDVAGETIAYTFASGDSVTDIAVALRDAVNGNQNLADLGITASNAAGVLTINSTNSFNAYTVSNVQQGDGATTTIDDAALERRAETITLTNVAVNAGDSYRVEVNGKNYTAVAETGDTMADIATSIANLINSDKDAAAASITAQVDTSGTNPLIYVDNGSGGSVSQTVTGAEDGVAAGGLYGLDLIDVTTQAGAGAALNAVEGLIQNSIDAAAAFGSVEGRIDTQSEFINNMVDSLTSGIGALVDTDMEAASARLQALQVQQQLGVQALSIANQQPQSILSLFR